MTKTYSNFWCILYSGRGNHPPRIDLYLENTNIAQTSCKKTILIEEAKWKKIESSEPACSFEVKHNKQYIFISASVLELELWILNLCCLSKELFGTKHVIGLSDNQEMDIRNMTGDEDELVIKENILYTSSSDLQTFTVSAEQTDGCLQVGLKGVYKLRIEEGVLRLFEYNTDKEVTCWPLTELKNYGFSGHIFFLQAGTRSKTGAGKYIFHTCEGERIVECLTRESERIRGNFAPIKALSIQAESYALSRTKPKPPAPPSKPKYATVRNSSNQNEQRRPSCSEAEDRFSKKMSPAFGVPVFAALTNATNVSRISDCSAPVAGNGSDDKERSNSLDGSVVAKIDGKLQAVARSVSSQSSETISKKDSKKMQKEFKKEQKKREEEEKKERKRTEEERKKEKKKMEEEEKKLKKEQKKNKQKASKTLSNSSQSVLTASQQVNTSENADAIDSPYAEVEPLNHTIQHNANQDVANSEKIYSEPWGNLPWENLPVASCGVGDGDAVEYAQPQKLIAKMSSIEPREIVHAENYEECQAVPLQDDAPEIISPNWEQDEGNASNNVYAHLKQAVPNEHARENVYGLASASDPMTFTEEENPYEETSISAYECVG